MNVILFGATGMVGQGVLRECLLDPAVARVLSIGRNASGQQHPKFQEIIRKDLCDYSGLDTALSGYDACFFCLGVSAVGMSEEEYRRVTYDIAVAAARTLVRLNPGMTFIYVSGQGTDSTGRGRVMWARVKGATENAIAELPFRQVFLFRPGVIQPLHGIQSRTRAYRVLYSLTAPLLPLLRKWFPGQITTTEQIGKAMLTLARSGSDKRYFENSDINAV